MLPRILTLITLFLPSILAVTLSGQVQFGHLLSPTTLPIGSKVSVNHGERNVWIKSDGSFDVLNVDEGEYVLEPLVPGYIFQPYLVTISPSTPPTEAIASSPASPNPEDPTIASSPAEPTFDIHVQPFYPAKIPLPTTSTSLPHPLILVPLAKEDYFTSKGGMNLGGMLKSPMVLMMLFSAVMLFALPKLTAAMAEDPEMAKEMADTRARMNNFQGMDFAGSLSNMLAGTSEDPPASAATTSGSNTPNRPGAGAGEKKRRGR
ncbi:uncharacterized protein I303_102658 [Kwoniella dejecticola CBS 10117]|uniref:ER membrane protein complex subunit 7 beta-sandwich domain-containing protein n=1 Tax=Kwoniella dejecticola CBS 10117 TaxID=1296121 RepID=A0A1A6A9C7_9TREE|nr:uncharacterized protein I303_02673 [Kwoniella dejecticola CBS 10117]OBR86662.1 hypothetical protein I303_02673 [Kwoniella dejecticola CBS 10117]